MIEVSVFCLAYNHEKYIRKTLEGFVSQITDFEYEVLINEDCSSDNTA
ncbi:MAG: glycosyltransferase [Lachnospiraceae bacterium]|nr:glycosyltransferase [Lachnospiraceae bacterium]